MGIKPTDILSIEESAIPKDVRKPLWIDFTEALFLYHMISYYGKYTEKEDVQWCITALYVRASDSYNSLFEYITSWDTVVIYNLIKEKRICIDFSLVEGLRIFTSSNPALYDDNEYFISQFETGGWEPEILERFRNDRDTVAKSTDNKKTCWGEFFG